MFIDPAGNDTTGDGSAGSPFRTPQRALDVVTTGGTVWVRPGAYPYRASISRPVAVRATTPGQATFGPTSDPGAVVAIVGADDVAIEGIAFLGSPTTRAVHANSGADRVTLRACSFRGFGAGAVLVDGPSTNGHRLADCSFEQCRGSAATAAVGLHSTIQAELAGCAFRGCDRGVDLVGATLARIADCTFTDLFQAAVVASGSTDLDLSDCRITRCGHFPSPRAWSTPADARGALSVVAFSHRARIARTLVEDCGGYTGRNTFLGAEPVRYDGLFGVGVADSADVRLEDCALHRNAFGGVHASGASPGLVVVRCNLVSNGERNDPGKDTALYAGGGDVTAVANFWGLPTGPMHDGSGFGNGIDGAGAVTVAPLAARPFVSASAGVTPWATLATGQRPVACVLGDFDGDGAQDVAVVEDDAASVSVLLNRGGGLFGPRLTTVVGGRPVALATGRLDAGGTLDLAILDQANDRVRCLHGNGDGTFTAGTTVATARRPVRLRVADLDGASGDDIAVACEGDVFAPGALLWLRNDGAGAFTVAALGGTVQPTDVELLDVDGDLRRDIVAFDRAAPQPGLRAYSNLGGGAIGPVVATAVDAAPVLTAALARADIDGGGEDLIVASYTFTTAPGTTTIRVFRGTGAGIFAPPVTLHEDVGPVTVRAAALGSPLLESVVAVNPGLGTVTVLGPTVPAPTPYPAFASLVHRGGLVADIALGDVSGDGRADLVFVDAGAGAATILRTALPAPVTTYGVGCFGTPGTPAARWHSLPEVGAATFAIAIERALPLATAVFMLGVTQTNYTLPGGCPLLVDPLIQVFTVTDLDGFGSIPMPIPPTPWLVGASLVGQWFVVDPGGQVLSIVSASDGVRFVVGG